MEGKSKPRELDTFGHVAFAVKKQRSRNVCMPMQFALSLYMAQGSLPGDDHASNFKWFIISSIIKIIPKDIPRGPFLWQFHQVDNTDHHSCLRRNLIFRIHVCSVRKSMCKYNLLCCLKIPIACSMKLKFPSSKPLWGLPCITDFPSLSKQFPKSVPSSVFKYGYWYQENQIHPQGHSVTHSQVRKHTSDCLQDFCFLFYYSQPIPHPLESLQLCLYPSGVFLPLSVMCFASLRCGHVFHYYPPETPVSFKETTPCHCLKWILLEAVLHSDSHLAHSVCIIQITLPICPWFARWHNSSECMLGFIQGLLLS